MPSSLVIVVGRTPAQLAQTPNTVQVTSVNDVMPGRFVPQCLGPGCPPSANPDGLAYFPNDSGGGANSIDLILSVVALAILTPVLIFIATATRLSAARREERFAAMRLVGATREQVSLLAAVESTTAGIAGMILGFGLFSCCASRSRTSRSSASPSSPLSWRSACRTSSWSRSACPSSPPSRPGWRSGG